MKHFYIILIIYNLAFSSVYSQVFWNEDFNDAAATTRWTTENAPGSKTNPTPAGITGLSYIANQTCNNYWVINDVNTPENNPYGVLPNGTPGDVSYSTRFVRGRNYNCSSPNDLPNPDPGGVTNNSLHITFQGCSDSYWFGLNNGPEDYADEYSILNVNGPASSGASSSDQYAYLTQDISTVGRCNIYLEGQFFLGGDQAQAHSYGTILYSINSGVTWKVLADNIGPTAWFLAGTCNNWETRSWLLPAECEGITTLRLAFRWRNDGDAIATTGDYTLMAGFNVDNIVLKQKGPTVDFDFGGVGSFILTTLSVCKLEQVTSIRNNTTGAGITGYQWNIPGATYVNGTSSTSFEPEFMFDNTQAFGSKNITLTVFYGNGCQASFSRTITLAQCLPTPDFYANYTTICATSPAPVSGSQTVVTLNNQTVSVPSRDPVTYSWNITGPGTVTYVGGTNSTSTNPQVTFSAVGQYTVTLTATNQDGSANMVKTNYINAVNCQCGSASGGTTAIVTYDWSADNNFLGWNVTQNQGSGGCSFFGFNNQWRVDDGESARSPGLCGTGGAGDRSLYFGYAAGAGAAFCAGGQNETDIIQSPLISTVGYTSLVLQFDFIGQGGGACCRADFQYSTDGGTTWTTPASPNFTTATPVVPVGSNLTTIRSNNAPCSPQGQWTRVTWNMPAACENISNLRIRFRFIISGATGAADPSFAVDKLIIWGTPPPSTPSVWVGNTADWHTATNWSSGTVPNATTSIQIPDVATLGPGKFMPVISSANAQALNVCNSGTITIQNNRTLTIGGFLNNYGAITTTTNTAAADVIFSGTACVYRGGGLNVDVDYQVGTAAGQALTLENNLSCRSLNITFGTINVGSNTITLKKDFTRAAGTTFNTATNSTFVFDGPMTSTWVNPYDYGTPTVTTQDVTTNQNITIGAATTFPIMIIRKQADVNVATLASAQTYTISNYLQIESGTLDANTRTLNGAGNVIMTGGQLRISKLATVVPEITGTYTLSGGTIDFYGAGNQTVRQLPAGSSTAYYNMIFQGSGTKTFQTGTTTCNNQVTIGGTATVDVQTNTFNGNANLIMQASACTLRVAKVTSNPTLPELLGTYTLSDPSVVELYTSAAGTPIQYLRNRTYARVLFSNPTANCIVTRYLEGNTTVNNEVRITNTGGTYPTTINIVDAQTYTFSGTANVVMANASALRLAKNGVVLPEFTGTYTYTDGPNIENSPAVELYGDGAQTLRLQPPANPYRNLIFTNIGTKTLQSGITTATRRVLITNGLVIVPNGTDQFNGGAELRMTGGELQIATLNTTASLIPEFTGGYVLAGGRITINGTGNQTIRSLSSTPTIQYYELNFAGTGIKDYSSNVAVLSRLLLNLPTSLGNYVLGGTNIMIVANTSLGAINRTGGHIVGHLQRAIDNSAIGSNYFFPVGSDHSNNTYYEPIFLKMNSVLTGTTSILTRFYNSGISTSWTPPITEMSYNYNHLETEGYWEMIPSPIPTGTIDYGVQVIPSSYWVYTGAQKALAKRSPSLAAPNDQWNWHGSTRISDFERTGYNSFSEFAIVTADVPLPVETTPLVAIPIQSQKAIKVQWNSLVEKDLQVYELEKSLSPYFNNPQKIQSFQPKGNNSDYEFLDNTVEWNTKYYYRYKAIDHNGTYRYSNIAEALLLPDGAPLMVQFYPNPMTDFGTLSITTGEEGNLDIQIYDAIGKLVIDEQLQVQGKYELNLFKNQVSNGVYTYRVIFNNQQITGKFIVK